MARLASWIAALPEGPWAQPDSGKTAGRLIALLPRQVRSNVALPHQTLPGTANSFRVPSMLIAPYMIIIVMAFTLGAQFIVASLQP